MKKSMIFVIIPLLLLSMVSATQLGVNYYHETMTTKEGYHYIPRTTTQVSSDLDNIKTISNYVKLYMNPLATDNLAWTNQVNTIAKNKGFVTTIVMNTEDRLLNDNNWGTYTAKVLEACAYFNNKASELVVGNEISLHTTYARAEIKPKVEKLINSCKQYFSGTVSYEAFWYEKDSWAGYPGRLQFNMYENIGSFSTNVKEMRAKFPTAIVGEFGEDLLDESVLRDEQWQKTELQKRFDILKNNNVPVAYVFTYKEPNREAFGLVRPDDSKRPAWYVFTNQPTIIQEPVQTSNVITTLPTGGCVEYSYGTSTAKICYKGSNRYEIYRIIKGTENICYKTYCVGTNTGFVSFTTTTPTTVPTTTTPTAPTTSNTITTLPTGGCVTGTYETSTVKVCDKGSGWYEMYLLSGTTSVCYKTYCVGKNSGFQRFNK